MSFSVAGLSKSNPFIESALHAVKMEMPKRNLLKKEKGWAGIIEILTAEHNCLLSLLDLLTEATEKLKPGKVPDYHLISDVLDYLTYYPDHYHHARENFLFGNLMSKHTNFKKKLDKLVNEHQTLNTYNNSLHSEFNGIAAGRRANRPELSRKLSKYIQSYRRHIDFEAKQVFPLAEGDISAKEWKQIKSKTRFVDDPLFGDAIQQKYHRLDRAIRISMGDLANSLPSPSFSPFDLVFDGIELAMFIPKKIFRSCNLFKRHGSQ